MLTKKQNIIILSLVFSIVAAVLFNKYFDFNHNHKSLDTSISKKDNNLIDQFKVILSNNRKVIVLLSDNINSTEKENDDLKKIGQAIFHDNIRCITLLEEDFIKLINSTESIRYEQIYEVLDYVENDRTLFDADRLAFKDVLINFKTDISKDSSLTSIQLHKRISDDLDAIFEIEKTYEKEIQHIYSKLDQRAITLKRERWSDYINFIKSIYNKDQLLKEYDFIISTKDPVETIEENKSNQEQIIKSDGNRGNDIPKKPVKDISGSSFPDKVIALTFDDGPHRTYTKEISDILTQYGVPATFFEVGQNIGKYNKSGKLELGSGAAISKQLLNTGFTIANHSMTHTQLNKKSGIVLNNEIMETDALLKAVDPMRSSLFRFPYGAKSPEALAILDKNQLKSIMWNIDSLDWADPVSNSIVNRVLQDVNKTGHGIILFHDIHDRTVKALPKILDHLIADGYQFASWNGTEFTVSKQSVKINPLMMAQDTDYSQSFAVIIGIDDYNQWPKLKYAANDAKAIKNTLIENYSFKNDHIIYLENKSATRSAIMSAFSDDLIKMGMKKQDRLFVFFAGHGATRKLNSGRDLGYIIPVDSSLDKFSMDAIAMTEIQNISENITAKHAIFIMDACYSGLGLVRGSGNFLRDNSKRIGRQMLTAGGLDQMVADGGPNGHSIFTWTLLQALDGKGDLNNDGYITATELAAYIAPAVSAISNQTPAFGSLPGSEGGDFVFEIIHKEEYLNEKTAQLPSDVIALSDKLNKNIESKIKRSIDDKSLNDSQTNNNDLDKIHQTIKDINNDTLMFENLISTLASTPLTSKQLSKKLNNDGMRLYKEMKYLESQDSFIQALNINPNFALAANNLGFVYFKQNKFQDAEKWFKNTLKMDPSRSIAYINLGDVQSQLNNNTEAKKSYSTYLALTPNGPNSTYARKRISEIN